MKKSYSIIIPSYNGKPLLAKHLPQVVKYSGHGTKIIIVDDGSIDGTVAFLKENYPTITCLHREKNMGFPSAINLGVKAVETEFFVLLNNDVAVTKNYLEAALSHFEDQSVFAVTLNETTSSWPVVTWQGKLNYIRGENKTMAHFSAWASGGSAIFRTKHWYDLGGFDEIYSPGYWEDIDIGWRAWKAGYSIIWEPKSKVIHEHESTFNLYDRSHLNLIKQRNELIFNWKNITDENLRRGHWHYLAGYSLGHPGYLKVILSALLIFPKIKRSKPPIRGDMEVLDLINKPVE